MKLRILMLLILLLIHPINKLSAQQSNLNNKNYENELEIDLNKTYTGEEVNQIITIILEEADSVIQESYNEGYKLAALEYESKITQLKNTIAQNENNVVRYCVTAFTIGLGLGFVTGNITGISIGIKVQI